MEVETEGKSDEARGAIVKEIISRQAAAFGHFGEFCQRPHTFLEFLSRWANRKG